MTYDTTCAHVLAGVRVFGIGRVYQPTASHIGRTARSCYKERAMGYSVADQEPEFVAIAPIGAALARLPTLAHWSHAGDPVV